MSANQQSFAAKAEQVRLRLASMQTAAASAGSRLFSPRPTAGSRPTVSFKTPPRLPVGSAEDLAEDSGEYSSLFVFAGGGAGDLSLFLLSPDVKSSLCQGVVKGGLKFCTLGAGTCSYSSHLKKKAVLDENHLYIAADNRSAFINHHIPATILNESQLSLILSERHTKQEWGRLLHAWNEKSQEDSKPDSNPYSRVGSLMVSSAVTPSRKRKSVYDVTDSSMSGGSEPDLVAASSSLSETSSGSFYFEIIPQISVESEDEISPEEKLTDIVVKWDLLVGNVNKMSEVFKSLRRNFGNDVELLHDKISVVDCRVGSLPTNSVGLEDCLSTWEGISFLHQGLGDVTLGLADLQGKIEDYEKRFLSISDTIRKLEKGSSDGLAQVKNGMRDIEVLVTAMSEEHELMINHIQGGPSTVASSSHVVDELQRLGDRLQVCEMALGGSKGKTESSSESVVSEILSLRADLKRVEARVPKYNNMMLGGKIFQSKVDVELFVSEKMLSNGFYLFHDAVTILESLTGAFQERKEVLSEWYQSTKVGCSAQEARHIASFKTTLPHVLGHSKDGVISPKHKLPAVKSYADWTTFDQDSGVMNYILRGIDDLKIQITNEIHSILGDDFPEAMKLAAEMHTASHYFICQMCTFVTDFVQEMASTAESPIEEAWELVSACVRKIFDELRRVRAAASNAMAEQNPVTKCALYMWCLIQANRVQKEFLDARFRNHPSIAPVIILHVFRTRVTKIAFKEGLKRLEGRIALLEKKPAASPGRGNNNGNNNNNGAKGQEDKK